MMKTKITHTNTKKHQIVLLKLKKAQEAYLKHTSRSLTNTQQINQDDKNITKKIDDGSNNNISK